MRKMDEQHNGESPDRDTYFVGDSMTAKAIEQLGEEVRQGFKVMNLRIDHLSGKHDFTYVEGCPSCESRKAAAR